ncbi:unnamed protein product [Plutella xylostella]|uniref:(diamondback moth) hypothetical protein n=1 Tax=Plutella xylostella TaxID=51655 RepID=A0A8S4GBI4_PLUXY|nr:unnamed protein product [Plutella xylostella]
MSGGGGGAPARYVSVSELYSADEVELLLEEIRELEPTSCRGEDLADCEIAGSGAARSPAPTERSWDSHAHYARAPPPPAARAVPLHCRLHYLLERDGLLTLLIIVLGLSCAGCVWAVAGLRGRVPGARARLLLLGGFSSALLHSTLFVMHLTHLTQVLPLRWDKLAMWTGLWSGGAQLGGALALLAALLFSDEYQRAAPQPRALLYSAVGLGMCGAGVCLFVAAGVLAACAAAARARALPTAAYRAVPPPPAHDDRL